MRKKDIGIEVEEMIRELLAWEKILEPVSEALTQLFREQIAYIFSQKSNFDSWGQNRMRGKVNGMIAAAAVLFDEWNRHHGRSGEPS